MGPTGSEVEVVWNGRRIRAFVPALLRRRDLSLDAPTAARAAWAATEVGHAAEALAGDYEPLARLLLRSEGVASSHIEGITAPVVDVVLAEEHLGRRQSGAGGWVASNLAAVSEAVSSAETPAPLSVEALCDWQRVLMRGSPTPERYVGRLRDEQGWICGTSPLDAHLVTPPATELPGLLEDLVAYVNRTDVDAVAQAAVSHAQFEVIHPFGDGNGRVGRMLVAWVLVRRLALLVPPPVSVSIAADVGGYSSGLVLFRLGNHLPWIRWFADAVADGARAQRALVAKVEQLKSRWYEQLAPAGRKIRSDAAVFAALDLLPRHVVLTSQVLVDELGLSRKTAVATLRRLSGAGIVTESGTVRRDEAGKPAVLYVSRELLGLAGSSPLR
ncbi:MAG TPA: Fic family protein [Acidimicrobiales bacterium]|nr:Fic family protein [Acidimicrobiales bacterium]